MVNNAMQDGGAVSDTVNGTVSPHLTRLLVRAGIATGLDRSCLVGVPGLAVLHEDGIRIPTATILRVWELVAGPVWKAGGSDRIMELWQPGTLGVWDYLFSASSTLDDAFRVAGRRFTAIADPADRLLVTRHDGGLTVGWQGPYLDYPEYPLIAEFVPYMLLMVASSGAGRRLTPTQVGLPHRPSISPERLAELYDTRRIDFEADYPSITFAEADVDAPLPRADPLLAAILDDHAHLSTAAARPVGRWLDRFHAILQSAIADGAPGLDQVARRLAMSPRTLQRRLREEGSSWREELEKLRQRRVDRLLRETSLSVDSIAARVGFTDSRALRRAINRWYGHGPAAVRASGPT
ncbi:helix-turn-helix domain-containing protein [Microbispora sp. RL4-1S]|uniref:Helix-turn-helix domain-containing protein n=1 Tax=Microbispora oryzae TaxID=2806554 RepID=A0A940WLE2_9ACTN|nr:AraC family transcriptional regulator [Microbispora oryzae]MBP2707780.1 helix-turn-helix domain-containing protein [Microbispora oryzae]